MLNSCFVKDSPEEIYMKLIITPIHKANGNADVTSKGFYAMNFIKYQAQEKTTQVLLKNMKLIGPNIS